MAGEPAVRSIRRGTQHSSEREGPDSVGAPIPEAQFLPGPPAPPPSSLINGMCVTLQNPDEQVASLGEASSSQRETEGDKLRSEHP